ncbi:unnamed protein product [Rhizophagus irregularis]|uniref:Uncharacterized protein n=1 Tax=Rhizophagus irregularis TaxID=588596 RepID=A0A916ECA4_9GLOM|nr:unnamed protein product [Rhizophagus irregularis]CAB5179266.1 unnamed protein product [Rhizophagus irregularis]CAB5371306.1 unnamed protein product [Rhizophagus irregularis]
MSDLVARIFHPALRTLPKYASIFQQEHLDALRFVLSTLIIGPLKLEPPLKLFITNGSVSASPEFVVNKKNIAFICVELFKTR